MLYVCIYMWLNIKPRLHDTTCCQTGCQTGLTTGCIVYTNIQPVVKPVWQPVCQPAVSCIQPIVKPVVQSCKRGISVINETWTIEGCWGHCISLRWRPIVDPGGRGGWTQSWRYGVRAGEVWTGEKKTILPTHLHLTPQLCHRNFIKIFGDKKLESFCYDTALFVWWYVYPLQNTG